MTTENNDVNLESPERLARMEAAQKGNVPESAGTYTETDFESTFLEPHVLTVESLEQAGAVNYCFECKAEVPFHPSLVRAYRMHVRGTPDPFKNFHRLLELHCFGCNFHEMVPVKTAPKTNYYTSQAMYNSHMQQQVMAQQQASSLNALTGTFGSNYWGPTSTTASSTGWATIQGDTAVADNIATVAVTPSLVQKAKKLLGV